MQAHAVSMGADVLLSVPLALSPDLKVEENLPRTIPEVQIPNHKEGLGTALEIVPVKVFDSDYAIVRKERL